MRYIRYACIAIFGIALIAVALANRAMVSLQLIPSEVAQKYLVVPVNRTGATLTKRAKCAVWSGRSPSSRMKSTPARTKFSPSWTRPADRRHLASGRVA